jgi:hypothetical protein
MCRSPAPPEALWQTRSLFQTVPSPMAHHPRSWPHALLSKGNPPTCSDEQLGEPPVPYALGQPPGKARKHGWFLEVSPRAASTPLRPLLPLHACLPNIGSAHTRSPVEAVVFSLLWLSFAIHLEPLLIAASSTPLSSYPWMGGRKEESRDEGQPVRTQLRGLTRDERRKVGSRVMTLNT